MKDQWGNWTYHQENQVLRFERLGQEGSMDWYEIDLETVCSTGHMLDWIFQVAGKGWMQVEDIGHLVRALDSLFAPQVTLCPGGQSRTIDPVVVMARVRKWDSRCKMVPVPGTQFSKMVWSELPSEGEHERAVRSDGP